MWWTSCLVHFLYLRWFSCQTSTVGQTGLRVISPAATFWEAGLDTRNFSHELAFLRITYTYVPNIYFLALITPQMISSMNKARFRHFGIIAINAISCFSFRSYFAIVEIGKISNPTSCDPLITLYHNFRLYPATLLHFSYITIFANPRYSSARQIRTVNLARGRLTGAEMTAGY